MNLKKTWLPDETLMGIFDQPIAEVGRAKYNQKETSKYTRWGFSYEAPFR